MIEGKGVKLGPVDRTHLGLLRAWRNDPRIFRWCRQNDVISDLHQEEWFTRQAHDPSIRMYLIHAPHHGNMKAVGVCGLTSLDPWNRRAEFSLYIAPDSQGLGHGKAALAALFTHGFRTLGLNCIWGESFDGNPACRMFEALGMKLEGTRRQFYFRDGKLIDAHLYSILAHEWA